MAATASELRRIYANLFSESRSGERIHALRDALDGINRNIPGSREEVDRLLRALNGGLAARLTFTQLECLRFVLSEDTFAPLMPVEEQPRETSEPLMQLYKKLFAEPDLSHLRALQQAVFDYDKLGTEPKRLAVLELLRDLSPEGDWSDAHIGALDALLVRDITFKQISPFQVTGDFW